MAVPRLDQGAGSSHGCVAIALLRPVPARLVRMKLFIRAATAVGVALFVGACSSTPTSKAVHLGNDTLGKATIGVSTSVPPSELAEAMELTNRVRVHGRLVDSVEGPAAEAGICTGDVLLTLGAVDLYSDDDIADFLSVTEPGARIVAARRGVARRDSGRAGSS